MSINNNTLMFKWISIIVGIIVILLLFFLIYKQVENFNESTDSQLNSLQEIFTKFFSQPKKWTGELSMLNYRKPYLETRLYKGEKSYTINKQKIYLCLKDQNNEYYPFNMLIYVLAHEYAHVLATSIGHTQEFHNIFDQLLEELIEFGIYDPNQPIINDYCQYND